MTLFDVAIALLVVVAATIGWRLGLARVILPLAAAGLVVWLSARYADQLIVAHTSPAQVVARGWLTVAAFVLAPALAAMVVSGLLGAVDLFDRRPTPVGKLFGAVAAIGLLASLVWILAPMSQRQDAFVSISHGSLTARILDDLPAPPVDVDTLIARGILPEGLDGLLSKPPKEPPPSAMPPIGTAASSLVRAGTVQVFAQRCGQDWTGSGFVVAPGTLATNAHVVSGAEAVEVRSSGGRTFRADVVLYDPDRDFALLRAPTFDAAPLPIADAPAKVGQLAVTAGHPNADTALHLAPARVDGFGFVTLDLPPGGLARREVYSLASDDVAGGSSGGPLVNAAGAVLGVVFASDANGTALALAADEIRGDVVHHGAAPVSTGTC
jgi:S1-C subfamily serine protease